jgi:hypothetical protein
MPSAAITASDLDGGSGGSGIPSAFPGGSGGNGMPSATCICVVLFVVVFRLTDEPAETTMDPTNNVRPESRAIFSKRIDNTSRCHLLRSPAKTIFAVQNVPISEH